MDDLVCITLKMTDTELTRRHSVRTVTHINRGWWRVGKSVGGRVSVVGKRSGLIPCMEFSTGDHSAHSGFASHSSAHDVVAWHLCSKSLRACNNQYFSIRVVKMCSFKIGSVWDTKLFCDIDFSVVCASD